MVELQKLTIRHGRLSDVQEMQQLFVDTLHNVCTLDYSEKQLAAWESGTENGQRWHDIIANQYLLVAENMGVVIGFASLGNKNHIDLLFVHKDYQGKGIAKALYKCLECEALRLKQPILFSDVSKTARAAFEKFGFTLVHEQTVYRQGVALVNYKMKKEL